MFLSGEKYDFGGEGKKKYPMEQIDVDLKELKKELIQGNYEKIRKFQSSKQ